MNNPGQYLVHLTSRGPKVFGRDGACGSFKCYTTQPMKDINKFGLLHYSIPKTLDHVQENNRRFSIRLRFLNGNTVDIPVALPLLDYNNVYASQRYDRSVKNNDAKQASMQQFGRIKHLLAFDEVLQSTINWSIMEAYDTYAAEHGGTAQHTVSMKVLARISCVVTFQQKTGTYLFRFGYRGNTAVADLLDCENVRFNGPGARRNTGCPFPTDGSVDSDNEDVIENQNNGRYTFISPRGITNGENHNDDPVYDAVNNSYPDENIKQACLVGVEFRDLSVRLQLMLGAPNKDVKGAQDTSGPVFTRGRIRILDYECNIAPNRHSGIAKLDMSIPPNLDPPNLLYLQLTVPGTKTRVLGQNDERGGWAIPTPQNQYVSKYNNLPTGASYDIGQARYIPRINNPDIFNSDVNLYFTTQYEDDDLASEDEDGNTLVPAPNPLDQPGFTDGVGYNFDPIPRDAHGHVGGADGLATLEIDNWNNTDAEIMSCAMRFRAAPRKFPRADRNVNGSGVQGLGIGHRRDAACFCSTMILPNWVFTSTEEATIQTFDIQLLWGDTCDLVTDITGHPVQFSIIASP